MLSSVSRSNCGGEGVGIGGRRACPGGGVVCSYQDLAQAASGSISVLRVI